VEAPADDFSAARAMAHIETIADEPRPVGSAQHAEARAYLLEQLASLGWRTEVQESVGMFDFGQDGTQSISAVANITDRLGGASGAPAAAGFPRASVQTSALPSSFSSDIVGRRFRGAYDCHRWMVQRES
jgi:hypothetical protein